MKYHFKVHKEKGGFWGESIEPGLGVNSQGDTLADLLDNLKDALDQALNEPESSRWIPPEPDPTLKGRNVYAITVSPRIAMATKVRVMRLRHGFTQKEAAAKLGIRHLSQYQRLESGATANLELETMVRLKQVYPEFSVDEVLA